MLLGSIIVTRIGLSTHEMSMIGMTQIGVQVIIIKSAAALVSDDIVFNKVHFRRLLVVICLDFTSLHGTWHDCRPTWLIQNIRFVSLCGCSP